MDSSQPDRPRISFPAEDYPVRVMGYASVEFREFVLEVFDAHAPGYDRARVEVRPSRTGKFESVCVYITATGEPQLKQLFEALKSHSSVQMVL